MRKNLLLGSKREHFNIVNNKIINFSENTINYLLHNDYTGKF